MKIDPTNIPAQAASPAPQPRLDGTSAAGGPALTGAAPEPSPGGGDQVSLSNLLDNLRRTVLAAENEVTPERAAFLDKLAAQVADGSYEIDAGKLSIRIIDDTVKGIG